MTWFADLSTYTYLPETVPPGQSVLTVGWLAPDHEFPVGAVSKEFADEFANVCTTRSFYAQTRGYHDCLLPHEHGEPKELLTIAKNGDRVELGSAEVRILTEGGVIFAAPNLIWHYVDYHHYLPPQEFIDAVLARRPGPPHYSSYRS